MMMKNFVQDIKEVHFQVTNPSVLLAQTTIPCSLTQVYDTTS